ncbi:cold-shock protein [Bifidobacterium magnum]|uniref:Cold shock protein n=1 Tax=Bifidobacterium magnum TaxID=1692 RepID=A0A087BCR3_9BIFI|nr:cold shock domain-containing protein [Bifidobacterium magnum]KFI68813.1 Cold shock protein [Bifidobacterium magnum]
MPSGRVRWFNANKGYGFIENEHGKDVFMPATSLPAGIKNVRQGAPVEYSLIDGRRGPQAMNVQLLAAKPSLVKATRPKPDDMAAIVEDLIKLLDAAGNQLRHHRYPSTAESAKLAKVMRAVADNFDVQD